MCVCVRERERDVDVCWCASVNNCFLVSRVSVSMCMMPVHVCGVSEGLSMRVCVLASAHACVCMRACTCVCNLSLCVCKCTHMHASVRMSVHGLVSVSAQVVLRTCGNILCSLFPCVCVCISCA